MMETDTRLLPCKGFVDLQVNGFSGVDFSSPSLTEERFSEACRAILQKGTAAFLPTIITSTSEVYKRNLSIMASVIQREEFGRRIPGIHIEGPFISSEPGAVGAHNPRCVRKPDRDFFRRLLEWADQRVCMLTLAAEPEGACGLTRFAVEHGITVSVGHSLAGEKELDRIADAGATAFTHLGNGLPNMLPRHRNTIWAALANDRLAVTLITDGHHLPTPILKTIFKAKGVENCIVISDAAPLAGKPPGTYETLGNKVVLEPSGLLHNPEKKCMVGSSATMFECMNHTASLGMFTFADLMALGWSNPLALTGIKPGVIAPPADYEVCYNTQAKRFLIHSHKAES